MIVANDAAVSLLGMPSGGPMVVPAERWRPELPECPNCPTVVRWATGRVARAERWRGFARLVGAA